MSEPTVDRDQFEVVAAPVLARYRAGLRPSIEEYAAHHSELVDQICALLPALVVFEQIAGVPQARSAPHRPTFIRPALTASVGSTEAPENDFCDSICFCTLVTLDP
jgi:hypothetical protein